MAAGLHLSGRGPSCRIPERVRTVTAFVGSSGCLSVTVTAEAGSLAGVMRCDSSWSGSGIRLSGSGPGCCVHPEKSARREPSGSWEKSCRYSGRDRRGGGRSRDMIDGGSFPGWLRRWPGSLCVIGAGIPSGSRCRFADFSGGSFKGSTAAVSGRGLSDSSILLGGFWPFSRCSRLDG